MERVRAGDAGRGPRRCDNFGLYVAVSAVTAAFSVAIGTLFVLGHGTVLPAFFSG
ncbi:MAG: hypothetical protein ABIQ73_10695 [Acidimicrobiales bacterium]